MTGPLRLGVIPTIAPYLLPALIPALAVRFPQAEANFRETQTERLLAEVEDGRLDAAIVALPVSEPKLTEVALFSEEFVLVRPIADANPFTKVTNASRALYNGLPVGNLAWQSLAWSVGIIVVFSFLSMRKFRNATR